MDDLARVIFEQPAVAHPRADALRRVTVLGAGRWHVPVGGRRGARVIAVRGRRGVGKSTVAANLAIALANLRSRVVLIDLDLGHPTQHELFGIAAPVPGLRALLHEQIDTIEQALTPTAVRNLYLVSAAGTAPGAGSADVKQQQRVLGQIWELDADVVIADIGSDPREELLDFFELGAMRLVVSASDPLSIRRSYNLFKESVVREVAHVAGGTSEGALLIAALTSPDARPLTEVLARLDGKPNVRAAVAQALMAFGGRLVGNRVRSSDEADLMHAASRLIGEYLGVSVPVLGVVEASLALDATRISGRPLLLGSGIDRNVRLFHSMAEQLLTEDADSEAPRCVARAVLSADLTTGGSSPDVSINQDGDPLPASLGGYMRRHPRHAVDWHAIYRSDSGRDTPVRIFELSLSGASIEALPGLDLGDRGRLVFAQIAEQPEIRVTVLDARRPNGRAGLRFEGSDDICMLLAAMAARVRSP
jgi:flagellar biosynthesis protein FlhG